MVGVEIVIAVLCFTSWISITSSWQCTHPLRAFPAGGTEQPRTRVGGVWLSQQRVMSGDKGREAIATEQQERAAAAK